MSAVIHVKILHHNFIPTIYGNLKSVFFYLSGANENLEIGILV